MSMMSLTEKFVGSPHLRRSELRTLFIEWPLLRRGSVLFSQQRAALLAAPMRDCSKRWGSHVCGQRNKRAKLRERERTRLAAIDEARSKIVATKAPLEPTISVDSLAILEEVMRHFYFKARILETVSAGEDRNEEDLDQAWAQAGKWAKEVAMFRHAKIAAIKLAGDPNEAKIGDQTIEQLRQGIMVDLEKLADVIDLDALSARSAIKRPD